MVSGVLILGVVLVTSAVAAVALWQRTDLESRVTVGAFRASVVLASLSAALGVFVLSPTIEQTLGSGTGAGVIVAGVLVPVAVTLYTVRQSV